MAAATMYVTVTGAGDKSGDSWANAMDLSAWENDVENNMETGDEYRVYSGTYTLTNNWNTTQSGGNVIGVQDQVGEGTPAVGDNRPLIAAGAYEFTFYGYHFFRNIRVTTAAAFGFEASIRVTYENCKVTQTSTGRGFSSTSEALLINCEIDNAAGWGAYLGSSSHIVGCLFTNSLYGGYISTGSISFSIFDTCTVGAILGYNINILNNSFFGDKENQDSAMIGIWGVNQPAQAIINNIFNDLDIGISYSTSVRNVYLDYNNFYENTTDINKATILKGSNTTTVDPEFTDTDSVDFSLGSNSSCRGAGFSIALGVGDT